MSQEEKKELINNEEAQADSQEGVQEEVQNTNSDAQQDSNVDSSAEETKESQDDYYKKELTKEEKRLGYNQRKKDTPKSGVDENLLEQKLQELRGELLAEKEQEYINSFSSSQDEANLIKHHLNNTIKRTGNLIEDIKTAQFIANRGKYEQAVKEIPAIQNAQKFGRVVQGQMKQSGGPQYSPEEIALMSKYGVDPTTGKISS